jgi:hypothetical protein
VTIHPFKRKRHSDRCGTRDLVEAPVPPPAAIFADAANQSRGKADRDFWGLP